MKQQSLIRLARLASGRRAHLWVSATRYDEWVNAGLVFASVDDVHCAYAKVGYRTEKIEKFPICIYWIGL